ncbi:MAG: DMT family transporter [Pseudomonadota bacterium]
MTQRLDKKASTPQDTARLGLLIAILATLFYSLKPILIKLIYQHDISSVNILAWRVIISLPIYLAVGLWLWRIKNNDVQHHATQESAWVLKTMALGVIGYYLAALLDLIGLQYISSQLARLILFTYPTLVAILAWMIFRQKVSRSVMIALVLSYVGVGFIFADDLTHLGQEVVFGSFVMFLSVLAFSLYVLLSKQLIDRVGSTTFTVVAMLASGICVLAHFLISTQTFTGLAISTTAFVLIALMTILTTVVPSFLIAEAIALVGPQKTAIAGTLGPAATSIFAVLLLGETFAAPQLAGIVLVVLAISYMQRDQGDESEDKVEVDY